MCIYWCFVSSCTCWIDEEIGCFGLDPPCTGQLFNFWEKKKILLECMAQPWGRAFTINVGCSPSLAYLNAEVGIATCKCLKRI